jgi:hypothetical protein
MNSEIRKTLLFPWILSLNSPGSSIPHFPTVLANNIYTQSDGNETPAAQSAFLEELCCKIVS